MGDATKISWTDATWNPVRGCSRVSEGCRNCYAERVAARFSDEGQPYHGLADRTRPGSKWTGDVRLVPEHLADPLRWKKPRRIFVNSMSDLFHERLPDDAIDQVFAVMVLAGQHTYQVLTKRAARMREYINAPQRHEAWSRAIAKLAPQGPIGGVNEDWWPRHARHIWLGVSVENQAAADERIPELLATPAAVRFLSCEPLIGAVNLLHMPRIGSYHDWLTGERLTAFEKSTTSRIDWIIAGCESGPGARRCDVAWLRSLRDQCASVDVPFFLKQAEVMADAVQEVLVGNGSRLKRGGVIELPYLDGVQHAAFPEVSQ